MSCEEIKNEFINCIEGTHTLNLAISILEDREDLRKENARLKNNLKEKIETAIDRLEALIIFWKKYNPIDNTMQVEQFQELINLLKGDEENENK